VDIYDQRLHRNGVLRLQTSHRGKQRNKKNNSKIHEKRRVSFIPLLRPSFKSSNAPQVTPPQVKQINMTFKVTPSRRIRRRSRRRRPFEESEYGLHLENQRPSREPPNKRLQGGTRHPKTPSSLTIHRGLVRLSPEALPHADPPAKSKMNRNTDRGHR
jgi:hypothetical protein